MEQYYLGGYYLIRLKPIDFGTQINKFSFTCSQCINDSLLDDWSYSWMTNRDITDEEVKRTFEIDANVINAIRQWVDNADAKDIGWINLFKNLNAAKEYKQRFFAHLPDLEIMSLWFNEACRTILINDLIQSEGIYEILLEQIAETDMGAEQIIGFDIVRFEPGGSFHSFQCYDMCAELHRRFGMETNGYGLFDDIPNATEVMEFMSKGDDPWCICKTKLVTD